MRTTTIDSGDALARHHESAPRVVFLFGLPAAAQSVGRALAEVPGVRFASVPTELFGEGLARFVGACMIGQLPGPSEGSGPGALFAHDLAKVTHELRLLADDLLDEVRAGADVLVEYSPGNVEHLELVHRLYPDAVFVHATGLVLASIKEPLRRGRIRTAVDVVRRARSTSRAVRASGVSFVRVGAGRLADHRDHALRAVVGRLGAA